MSEEMTTELSEGITQRDKYMTFKSGNEYFAIGIEYINEIIPFQRITVIPETESYIKGLINLRGKIIPVVDVALRFNQPPLEYNDRTCIIVIDVKATVVGLIVERIAEVVTIEEEDILPPPSIGRSNKVQNKYVYGIGKTGDCVKLLLDLDKFLHDEDSSIAEQADSFAELEE